MPKLLKKMLKIKHISQEKYPLVEEIRKLVKREGFELVEDSSAAFLAVKNTVSVIVTLKINILSVYVLSPEGNRSFFVSEEKHIKNLFDYLLEIKK